jgi:two-component system nitrate/nitrite response regulator NarL
MAESKRAASAVDSALTVQVPAHAAVRSYRIVLVDQQPMFRRGVRAELEGLKDCVVIGEADDVEGLRPLLQQEPDLLIVHGEPSFAQSLELMRDIVASGCTVRSLVICANITPEQTADSVRLGAVGVLPATLDSALLRRCLEAVRAGEFWLPREGMASLVHALRERPQPAGRPYGLTPRELDVVLAVVEGLSNREIAAKLSIREDTVKHHLSAAFDKTGTFSRVELAVFAMNHRIARWRCGTA